MLYIYLCVLKGLRKFYLDLELFPDKEKNMLVNLKFYTMLEPKILSLTIEEI